MLTRDAPPIYELEGIFTDASGRVVGLGLENVRYLPPELGNLSNLRYLRLNGVKGEIPPEPGNLTNLTSLHLVGRFEREIPPELGNLTNLRELYLSGGCIPASPPPFLEEGREYFCPP